MKKAKVKRKNVDNMVRLQLYIPLKVKTELRKFAGSHSFGVGVEELLRRERERQRALRVITQSTAECP